MESQHVLANSDSPEIVTVKLEHYIQFNSSSNRKYIGPGNRFHVCAPSDLTLISKLQCLSRMNIKIVVKNG